jgi:ribosomal protein S18 acetylase RimI-like enzyme
MLTYAASMDGGGPEQIPRAQADPYSRLYVESWGRRQGDLGVVAIDKAGRAVGAAWLRHMPKVSDLAVGNASVPELATGVVPEFRGRGIGRRLMALLIRKAAHYPQAIVISVREENRAADSYRSLGFIERSRVVNRVGGASLVMDLRLEDCAGETRS